MKNDDERIEEINITINLIQGICETAGIGIIAKNNKVAVLDSFSGQEYYLFRQKEADNK